MNFGILMVQGLVNSFGFEASAAFAVVVYYLRRRKVLLGKKQKRN
nr:hypothetical protein [Hespellia stercorisuis]